MKYFFDDLKVYREGLLAQGFWALQIYRFGHARFKYTSNFIRLPWGAIHLLLSKLSEVFFGIHIGVKAKIGRRLIIEHFGSIVIHGSASIGDDCVVRQDVTIGNRQIFFIKNFCRRPMCNWRLVDEKYMIKVF